MVISQDTCLLRGQKQILNPGPGIRHQIFEKNLIPLADPANPASL